VIHQRFGRGPCAQFRCLRCGGRIRKEVMHWSHSKRALCGRNESVPLTEVIKEVSCPDCAAQLLSQKLSIGPTDWRPAFVIAEDNYAH
jgi:hypothetical protein